MLKSESFLPQLTVEHARVVNVELLAGLKVLCFFLHCHIRVALSVIGSSLDRTAFEGGSRGLLSLALAEAKNLD